MCASAAGCTGTRFGEVVSVGYVGLLDAWACPEGADTGLYRRTDMSVQTRAARRFQQKIRGCLLTTGFGLCGGVGL